MLAAWLAGAVEGWQNSWRSGTIALARHVDPRPPDPNDPDFALCLLYAASRENPALPPIPVEGRFSEDPEVMVQRLALLLGTLAALPPEYRPRAVGLDMVLATPTLPESAPYLREAIRRLGAILSATEEKHAGGTLLLPHPAFGEVARALGLDTFRLPAWGIPSAEARMYATLETQFEMENNRPIDGFGPAVARDVAGKHGKLFPKGPRLPMHYWSLYEPAGEASSRSGMALAGLWPAELALSITHAPREEDDGPWAPVVPRWYPREEPESWLVRVQAALVDEENAWGGRWADLVGPMVAGRIVLVGAGLPHDAVPTPFTSRLYRSPHRQNNNPPMSPGLVLHANSIATLLKWKKPLDVSVLPAAGGLALVAFLLAWSLAVRLPPAKATAIFLLGGAGLSWIDLVAAGWANVWLPAVPVLLAWTAAFTGGGVTSWMLVRQSREHTAAWLRRLLPTAALAVVDDTAARALAPTGQPASAWRTVLLCDMAGYTTFVRFLETRGRRDLALRLISDCFTRLVTALDRHGGRLTDLTGDGLVALFDQENPATQAREAHAAALAIVTAFRAWRAVTGELCASEGLAAAPLPGLRIALGAGETDFQFIGSAEQQKPLFFGGAFILAARIEAKLKDLPLPAGASATTRLAFDGVVADLLGSLPPSAVRTRVSLKGLDRPVEIVEIPLSTGAEA
jgi:class 3 adenylate cyclase/CHASE2 domain-containing sensor protein